MEMRSKYSGICGNGNPSSPPQAPVQPTTPAKPIPLPPPLIEDPPGTVTIDVISPKFVTIPPNSTVQISHPDGTAFGISPLPVRYKLWFDFPAGGKAAPYR